MPVRAPAGGGASHGRPAASGRGHRRRRAASPWRAVRGGAGLNGRPAPVGRRRSVHGWVSAALIAFGLLVVATLTVQNIDNQGLVVHRFWAEALRSASADHAAQVRRGQAAALPHTGIVRSWYVGPGAVSAPPAHLAGLAPGYYSTEHGLRDFAMRPAFEGHGTFHAMVVELAPGRLITAIDIAALEDQQNFNAKLSMGWAGVFMLLIGASIAWLHANLARPVRDLAARMQAIDPRDGSARLPTTSLREEIRNIAQASNLHLERVARFVERERSLLDQASHEFRIPIAVIAGAVDMLAQMPLPAASRPALARIAQAVEGLSETMVALLYLAREAPAGAGPTELTVLHELLPRLAHDHEHLLRGKAAQLRVDHLEPTCLAAPEAMVRIAVSNLIRNAIENTQAGQVRIGLAGGVISVADSGSGFDPGEAARRYRQSLQQAAPVRGQGLGLFLIGRICDRFGWTLAIEPGGIGGTCARLDVSASVIVR